MERLQRSELRRINDQSNEYEIVIYLADYMSEFANELGTLLKENKDIVSLAKQIVNERYPNIKVTMVKVMIGGIAVTSLSLISANDSTAYASTVVDTPSQEAHDESIYYHITSGDTLWILSRKFNTTVDQIKRANNLTSDILQLNQRLIIPKAFHTVGTGDYLTVLAKKYGVTVAAIKEANNLTNDNTRLGQILIIPTELGVQTHQPAPADTASPQPVTQIDTYMVVSGDSLSAIAKRFGTTVDALRTANHLSSDLLRIGQTLNIPTNAVVTSAQENTAPATVQTSTTYTVVSGDSLSLLAKRFGTTVEALRTANHLSSDLLKIGQVLNIPTGKEEKPAPISTSETVKEERTTFTYSVRSGDSLSVIAKKFAVTVDSIRSANQLTSDTLQVGQALTIQNGLNAPEQAGANTITYTTHTVASGDNIWNLSVRYGIPQNELLRTNNLTTSSMLSIGQKLKIPVHTISVKPVINEKYGEYLDWWTEAQYIFTINKTAKVTDLMTGKSFTIKRTIGANHADSETISINDTNIAKSIWGGFTWTPRAVILEIDGRKIAASMSFMPHDRDYIANNGITGHFDVYFANSTRHIDGKPDASHQAQVEKAAGLR